MPRPKLDDSEKRDKKIMVRFTEAERTAFNEKCIAEGRKPSTVIRDLVNGYMADELDPYSEIFDGSPSFI